MTNSKNAIDFTETTSPGGLDGQFGQLVRSQGIEVAVDGLAAAGLRAANRGDQQLVLRLLSAGCFSHDKVAALSTYLAFKCGKTDFEAQNLAESKWLTLLEAEKLMQAKQVKEALAIFRLGGPIKQDVGSVFGTQRAVAFASALVANSQFHWAKRVLGLALENGVDRALVLHAQGTAAMAQGDRLSAASYFLDAVEEDAGFLPAYVNLEFALDKFENLWGRAAALLEKAYGNGEARVQVVSALHRVYELRGDIASATALNREFVAQAANKKIGVKSVWPDKEPKLDFIIVGASKCGTSSLFSWLGQHPKAMLPHTKEINFFSGDRYANGIGWYLSHFSPLCDGGGYFTGESSPGYFGRTDISAERIRQGLRSVKIIMLLRNPADRTLSAYHHVSKVGRLKLPSRKEAVQLWCGRYVRDGQNNAVSVSVYAPRVRQWFNVFGRENCLVINADQLFKNPSSVMPSVFEFLQVDPVSMAYGIANAGTYQKDEAFEQERQDLLRFFEPSIRELEHLLGYGTGWLD
jgi:tetratricopeptide (TPR) repeat protein